MRAEAKLYHTTSERSRLAFPDQRDDELFLARMVKGLQACPSVDRVQLNPTTGSLTIYHHAGLSQVTAELAEVSGFELDLPQTEAATPAQPLAQQLRKALLAGVKTADRHLLAWTDGQLDFVSLAGLTLAGLTWQQYKRGMLLPAGLTMLVLAYRMASATAAKESTP